jgi:hypothetical protein
MKLRIVALVFALSVLFPASALAAKLGTIAVNQDPAGSSHFAVAGCGFRADSPDYAMVVVGPAPDTASLAYWVDPFPVDANGCGSASVSWTSSGVPGSFQVYVARSSSDNFWRAQPASNVVVVIVTTP